MPGGAEIGDYQGAGGRGDEEVGGLDISVDDPVGMEMGEAGKEVDEEVQELLFLQWSGLEDGF